MEEETRYCDFCGTELDEDEGTWVNDELLCDDCCDEHTITCDCCGESVWTNDCVTDDNTFLCGDCCFDSHYSRCECCGVIMHNDCTSWRHDLPYCTDCFDEYVQEIEEYNYKPEPEFFGDGNLYMGVELEVDTGGKDDENARILKEIANSGDEHIYIKSDGSLEDGFEIVSHPMTLKFHQEEMEWEEVLKEAVNMGYRSHQTSTCGLHVHVNRNAFGDNQAEQEEVIAKILFFIEKHWAEIFKFSRRTEYNMNRWSSRYGLEKTGKEILEKAKGSYTSRYVAVNLKNVVNFESIKNVAETVQGSFMFTILRNDNSLFLVKGSNPIALYHFPEYGLYIYASTKEILEMALLESGFAKCKHERIVLNEGDILKISADGKMEKEQFEVQEDFFTSYKWHDYCDWYECNEFEEDDVILDDDIAFLCYCFGVDEKDIETLLDYGYTLAEIEDMLLDTDCFEEALKEAKTLFDEC